MSRTLMIYARYPVLGYTKTRLAARLGNEATLLLYEAMLADTAWSGAALRRCRHMAALVGLPADQSVPRDPLGREPFNAYFLSGQRGDDFGARLGAAMQQALLEGNGPAVLVGADSPEISTALLERAFDTLEERDVVLGPAADGGYYLIGMRSFQPALFRNIPWSTAAVLEATAVAAADHGLTCGRVDTLGDLDYFEDLQALAVRRQEAWRLAQDSPCPATDAWLRGELPGQHNQPPNLEQEIP